MVVRFDLTIFTSPSRASASQCSFSDLGLVPILRSNWLIVVPGLALISS